MEMEKEALERLREAESFIGSPVNDLFGDDFSHDPRGTWLRSVREILVANGIEPENLAGRWHTFPAMKKPTRLSRAGSRHSPAD